MSKSSRRAAVLFAVHALLMTDAGAAMALTLTSTAFEPGGQIPSNYTCEGDDISPPLAFAGAPPGTKSLALIIDDPDAPDPKAPKRVWAHWLVYNLPPDTQGLAADASRSGLPKGAVTGLSDRKEASYHGPCPPIGRHRYFHKLYALDAMLPTDALTKAELEAAMAGHVLAAGGAHGHLSEGRSLGPRLLTVSSLDCGLPTGLSGAHG
jgi:Raf kinase inhibitor-like YbhB/YbcL family protein